MEPKRKSIESLLLRKHTNITYLLYCVIFSLLLRDIPFLNVYIPLSLPLLLFALWTILLFQIHTYPVFWFMLLSSTSLLYVGGRITQAELFVDLIVLIVFIIVVSEIIKLFRNTFI